jgi:predicted acyltransferase
MSTGAAPAGRLVSLDAFRGATIAGMLLVNNPGSWSHVYAPLLHAPWHGWTPTDLVFPCFLWITGVSMALSFGRRAGGGADRGALLRHAARRSAIIVGLGLALNAFPFGLLPAHHFSLETLRLPGVLQRIGLCTFAASAIVLTYGVRGRAAWAVGLLAGYWALLKLVPVPGHGAGVLEPLGSLPWWIDSHLLKGHTWSGAPAPGFDPEGILSTLPAIGTVLAGVLAGEWLRGARPAGVKSLGLAAGGVVLLGLGALLDRWMPINKPLWTPTYAIFMAGWAMVLFAACHALIDGRGWRAWAAPFVWYGMNALAMFVLAGVVAKLMGLIRWTDAAGATVTLKGWFYATAITPYAEPKNASLVFAVLFVLGHLVIAWAMWRRRWFIKV